ncbi:hypothetical protein [Nocardioides sp. Kera G14]|nr:hypothetical protein [Nocardioides sp. Kera G14]UDY22460.1 hypothetical protein LH076_10245 [Nocardioides sp. Kera G14]
MKYLSWVVAYGVVGTVLIVLGGRSLSEAATPEQDGPVAVSVVAGH